MKPIAHSIGTSSRIEPPHMGETLKSEFSKEPHVRGSVSMARTSDPNSARSQFFIVFKDSNFLDGQYTVWGKVTSGMEDEFRQTQQQSGGRLANLIDFLVIDENNPSSLVSSIGAARRNAREERNNITVDVWESLNGLWLELSERLRGNRTLLDRGALIESVKKQAVMIFGAAQVTLLRDEAYNFLQLGAFLERADNTARILDVKFHGRYHPELDD